MQLNSISNTKTRYPHSSVSSTFSYNPLTGRKAVEKFLEIIDAKHLWVKPGHNIYYLLRLDTPLPQLHRTRLEISADECKAKGWDDSVRSRSRSIAIEPYSYQGRDAIDTLLYLSRVIDGGVFFIPTQPDELPLKEFVRQSDNLACEIDNASTEEQIARYEYFIQTSELDPAFMLSSGGKSVHANWKTDKPYPIDEMERRNRALIVALGGDPAVTRPHQPVRMPALFRKEKGNYQELLGTSTKRYSLDEIDAGLEKVYTSLGWPTWVIKEGIPDQAWLKIQRLTKEDIPHEEYCDRIREILEKAHEVEPKRSQRSAKAFTLTAGGDLGFSEFLEHSCSNPLFDEVKRIEAQLSPEDAFNNNHDWTFSSASHARGHCHRHDTSSNSAWTSLGQDGTPNFHCPICNNNKPLSPFGYWWWSKTGDTNYPRGQEWVKAAKEWLQLHGVDTSEFETAKTTKKKNKFSKAIEKLEKKSKEAEKKLKKYYEDFFARLGIKEEPELTTAKAKIEAELRKRQVLSQKHKTGFFEALKKVPDGERKLIVLDGQKGTGKTSKAILSVISQYQTVAVFSPTTRLNEASSNTLDVAFYKSIPKNAKPEDIPAKVALCPESAWKTNRWYPEGVECVVLDEVNEDIERVQAGTLGTKPKRCLAAMQRLLQNAKCVVIATDQMYRASVAATMRMGEFSPDEVEIIQRKRKQSKMTITLYENGAQGEGYLSWVAEIIRRIGIGENLIIPMGSQAKARELDRLLSDKYGKQGQVIDGKYTPSSVKSEFCANPNGYAKEKNLRWLIYTPTFNSGVSIEDTTYFHTQFEYITTFEPATAASQRGERYRAITNGQVTERHVYMSKHGLATEPDPNLFFADHWRKLLLENKPPSGHALQLAKAFGFEHDLMFKHAEWANDQLQKVELPEYLAIRARETYFKRQCLFAEWRDNGWKIKRADLIDKDARDAIEKRIESIKEVIVDQRANTFALAKAKKTDHENLGPISAVKDHKHRVCEQVGKSFAGLEDKKWVGAWVIDPGNSGGISAVRIHTLVRIMHEQPGLWDEIKMLDSLKTVALSAEIQANEELPDVPVSHREIETAEVLADCPGIKEIINGTLEIWDKTHSVIKSAASYLRKHALQLSQLSANNQRIHGLQFREKTPDISCMQKALKLLGITQKCTGRKKIHDKRIWQYRLETSDDVRAKIEGLLKSDTRSPRGTDYRKLHRTETHAELLAQCTTHIMKKTDLWSKEWKKIAELLAQHGCLELQLIDSIRTEVLDTVSKEAIIGAMKGVQGPCDLQEIRQYTTKEERQTAWDDLIATDPDAAIRIEALAVA